MSLYTLSVVAVLVGSILIMTSEPKQMKTHHRGMQNAKVHYVSGQESVVIKRKGGLQEKSSEFAASEDKVL